MHAGAIALDVFRRNPKHPGAVHYIIHAFDDPVHAPLALDAARAYAEIVPAVSHAVHMPTHIFIQHGMWNEVAQPERARVQRRAKICGSRATSPGDMAHSGDWGQYGFLQLGDYAGAASAHRGARGDAGPSKHPRAASVVALTRRATSSKRRSGRCSRWRTTPRTKRCWPTA